jgi:hypothetical protein
MVFPIAAALMGAGVREKRLADEQDQIDRDNRRQTEKDNQAWMAEQRTQQRAEWEFNKGERARMLKNREAVSAAAAPIVPLDGTIDMPTADDDGNAAPVNPTAGTFTVQGQRFANRAGADTAAAEANAPARRTARMSAALEQGGDMAGAQQLRTGARQEQLADLQLTQAQLAAERDKGLREVGKLILAGGWASVPQVYDKYRDGAKASVQEDGKGGATITYVGADGQPAGSKTYKALPEFFADVAGGFDPSKWFDYQNNKADKERVQANADRDFKLRETAEGRRATHEARMLSVAERTARAAERNGTPTAATAESTFDRKTAAEIAKDTVKKEAEAAAATGTPMSGAMMAKRVDEITGAMFQQHANRFIASTVQRELQMAQGDPAAYAQAWAKASQVLPPAALQSMGFKNPAAPAPGTPADTIRNAPPGSVTLRNGQWVPAAGGQPPAGPAAAAAAPRAQMGQAAVPGMAEAEKAANDADLRAQEALRKYQAYGSRQKALDPQGFAKAELEANVARSEAQAAQQRYAQIVSQTQSVPRMVAQP